MVDHPQRAMIRHDEIFLKQLHKHVSVKTYELSSQLPFFYFQLPDDFKTNDKPDADKISLALGEGNYVNDVLPFDRFAFILDNDPSLHVFFMSTSEMYMVDYFHPVDYPSSMEEYYFGDKGPPKHMTRGIWAQRHRVVGGFNGDYSCESRQYYNRKIVKDFKMDPEAQPEMKVFRDRNKSDFDLILGTILALFIRAEDTNQRLIRVADAPRKRNRGDNTPQKHTSRWAPKHHYVYLDGPPAHVMSEEQREATGRTVRGHARRAHWHKLTHPRYKNHPNYGGRVRVKSTWVGPVEWVDEGKIYTLHDPEKL